MSGLSALTNRAQFWGSSERLYRMHFSIISGRENWLIYSTTLIPHWHLGLSCTRAEQAFVLLEKAPVRETEGFNASQLYPHILISSQRLHLQA